MPSDGRRLHCTELSHGSADDKKGAKMLEVSTVAT